MSHAASKKVETARENDTIEQQKIQKKKASSSKAQSDVNTAGSVAFNELWTTS